MAVAAETTPVAMYEMIARHAAKDAIGLEVVLISTLYAPPFMGSAEIASP